MKETEKRASNAAAQKAKIRERYKGVSIDELDVIPAMPAASLDDINQTKRVAVYARVSTDDPRLFFASSFCRKVQNVFVGKCNYIL